MDITEKFILDCKASGMDPGPLLLMQKANLQPAGSTPLPEVQEKDVRPLHSSEQANDESGASQSTKTS